MTSPTHSGDRLAGAVGDAVPYGRRWPSYDYRLAIGDVGEPVAAAYRTGGVEAAAQAAYTAGYRAGEHVGQLTKAGSIRTALDATPREPLTPQWLWLADTAGYAHEWVVDADREVIRARNPYVPVDDLGPALRHAAPHQDDGGVPRAAALAYTRGFDRGQQHAKELTAHAIAGYAYQRAAELGVSLPFVDEALRLSPGQRPTGLAEPAAPGTGQSAAEVSRLSFARPASATASPPATPGRGPGRSTGASRSRHR